MSQTIKKRRIAPTVTDAGSDAPAGTHASVASAGADDDDDHDVVAVVKYAEDTEVVNTVCVTGTVEDAAIVTDAGSDAPPGIDASVASAGTHDDDDHDEVPVVKSAEDTAVMNTVIATGTVQDACIANDCGVDTVMDAAVVVVGADVVVKMVGDAAVVVVGDDAVVNIVGDAAVVVVGADAVVNMVGDAADVVVGADAVVNMVGDAADVVVGADAVVNMVTEPESKEIECAVDALAKTMHKPILSLFAAAECIVYEGEFDRWFRMDGFTNMPAENMEEIAGRLLALAVLRKVATSSAAVV
jgi:hypothetical protein